MGKPVPGGSGGGMSPLGEAPQKERNSAKECIGVRRPVVIPRRAGGLVSRLGGWSGSLTRPWFGCHPKKAAASIGWRCCLDAPYPLPDPVAQPLAGQLAQVFGIKIPRYSWKVHRDLVSLRVVGGPRWECPGGRADRSHCGCLPGGLMVG